MKDFQNRLSHGNYGFTMMELIVAMIIISILTSGGLYIYSKYMGISRVTAAINQISSMKASVLNYMSQNQGSISNISVTNMINSGVLGKSWTASAGFAPGTACPTNTAIIYHCDPWNGAITVGQDSTISNVYTINFGLVPENDAYKMAQDLFNSVDNSDSGLGSGIIFNGSALTPNDKLAATSNTTGTLTLYFKV
jgi:prepilin-type N-terminal cleavage/methylation domain-containing protein